MSTHNIGFYEEISKIITILSSNIIKYTPYFFCWADNQRLKAEVNALKKFKKRLETVLQNHVTWCNVRENTSTGYFTNLLQYTNSAKKRAEGCSMVSSKSTVANPPYYSLNGDTIDTQPPYVDVPRSTTNAMQTFTRIGNRCLPDSERFENAQLVNREQTMSLNDLNGMPLRSMSKEQKISLLKAYLKGNQSKPEVQKHIRYISQMTRTEQCMQNV